MELGEGKHGMHSRGESKDNGIVLCSYIVKMVKNRRCISEMFGKEYWIMECRPGCSEKIKDE